jgi:DNA-binding MarR family transcriptional regulator
MKHLHTVVVILLNTLFCTVLLWFFTQNAYLRPYAGSATKEILAGLLLLISLYVNYFVFYPMLCRKFPVLYWGAVVILSMLLAVAEMVISNPTGVHKNALLEEIGLFSFYLKPLFFVFGRNLAFNFVPFVIRNMQHLKEEVDTKVQIIYQKNRLLDVCDRNHSCHNIPIDDILYIKKEGNYVYVNTIDGTFYTRYCSIKYLEQLFEDKEFIRISSSVIVPYQYIESYDEKQVVMKKMPFLEKPLTFALNPKTSGQVLKTIAKHLRKYQMEAEVEELNKEMKQVQDKKPLSIPPQEKLDTVYAYIRSHPGSRSNEITTAIRYSQSTIERCLVELRKQGLVEYVGSKKTGGYCVCEGDTTANPKK